MVDGGCEGAEEGVDERGFRRGVAGLDEMCGGIDDGVFGGAVQMEEFGEGPPEDLAGAGADTAGGVLVDEPVEGGLVASEVEEDVLFETAAGLVAGFEGAAGLIQTVEDMGQGGFKNGCGIFFRRFFLHNM